MLSFIVAEIGVNWDGDYKLAKKMMNFAKKSGCNAVKFQAFDEKILRNHSQKERLLKTSISKKNIKKIDHIAKSIGIEWFCTPMYPEAVEMLEPYVKRYKIRFGDSKTIFRTGKSDIFEKILKTKKEIIISSKNPPTQKMKNKKIKWLYVVPKYPCNLSDINFKDLYKFDGYSNHCPNIVAPLTASILGAEIIEIHITLDKSKDFIDNNVSFNPDELTELVKLIRLSEKIKK